MQAQVPPVLLFQILQRLLVETGGLKTAAERLKNAARTNRAGYRFRIVRTRDGCRQDPAGAEISRFSISANGYRGSSFNSSSSLRSESAVRPESRSFAAARYFLFAARSRSRFVQESVPEPLFRTAGEDVFKNRSSSSPAA